MAQYIDRMDRMELAGRRAGPVLMGVGLATIAALVFALGRTGR